MSLFAGDFKVRSNPTASQQTEYNVFNALKKHMNPGARVVIFGSTEPMYESAAIVLGASEVVVVDYNKLTFGTYSECIWKWKDLQRYDSFVSDRA